MRMLARSPVFAIAAVLTLGLGIGANTAIFSLINAVLLRPLPYYNPSELVSFKPETYDAFVKQSKAASLASAGAYTYTLGNIGAPDETARVWTLAVTASVLPTLGVAPMLGRGFTAEDDARGAAPRVLLSHGFWRQHFGADRSIIGRMIMVDGRPHEVIGVLPPELEFPPPARRADGSMPMVADAWLPVGEVGDLYERGGMLAIARVKTGTTGDRVQSERVQAEITALSDVAPLRDQAASQTVVTGVAESVTSPIRSAVLVLAIGVAFVLLIACANLGSLLLARLAGRNRELAVRISLGASGSRIIRQIVTEGMVLAFFGGCAGVALGTWLLRGLLQLAPPELPRAQSASMDGRVMLFATAITVTTAILITLLPALRQARRAPGSSIRSSRGAATDRHTTRMHHALVVAEVAIAVILLCGAGLLLRSYSTLSAVSPGFDTNGLVTADINVSPSTYPQREDVMQLMERAESRLAALPGVTNVGAIDRLPYGQSWSRVRFQIAGRDAPVKGDEPVAYNASARAG
jgi:predicted permease